MPFGRKHAGVDGSSSGDGSSGTTSSSNNEENGGVDQYARFTTVLRAIEFECRLKREWQDRTCSSASTPERHDGDKDGAGPDEGGDGRSAQTNDGTSDDLPESNGLKERPFFEHFVVCGLPPDADVVAAAVSSRQAKNARQSGADAITNTSKAPAYRQPGGPMYPAQVLYSWSREDKTAKSEATSQANKELIHLVSDLCFPNGVGPSLVERRPSMSDINELLYGLKFEKEDSSFTFIMKGFETPMDDGGLPRNLYGVAISENEMMKLAPSKVMTPNTPSRIGGGRGGASVTDQLFDKRYIVTAPRCYCLLSYYPFFELHFDILSTVLKIERVERLRKLMSEPTIGMSDEVSQRSLPSVRDAPTDREHAANKTPMGTDGTAAAPAAADSSHSPASGTKAADEDSELKSGTPAEDPTDGHHSEGMSPGTRAHASAPMPIAGGARAEPAGASKNNMGGAAECEGVPVTGREQSIPSKLLSAAATATTAAVASLSTISIGTRSKDASPSGSGRNSPLSSSPTGSSGPSTPTFSLIRSRAMSRKATATDTSAASKERRSSKLGPAIKVSTSSPPGPETVPTLSTSSARDAVGEASKGAPGMDANDDEDEDEEDDFSTILAEYWRAPVPRRGYSCTITFSAAPLEVKFKRWHAPRDSSIPYGETDNNMQLSEAAGSAGAWAVCTLCKSLSLENMITMLSCVLLEKQIVVFCPSLGVLTGVVWSMQPLILPFVWQSVLFPVMPSSMIEFLDAPVPFIAGIQHKTDVVREKSSDLIRVNVYKDKINYNPRPAQESMASSSGRMLLLPKHAQLAATISSHYEILAKSGPDPASQPIFRISKQERKHAEAIIALVNRHLVGLCSNILHHSITHVNEKNQRVTLLLKESFLGSFTNSEHSNFGGGHTGAGNFHGANSGLSGGFSTNEREFMEMFVDTQMFNAYSDSIFLQQQKRT